MSARSAAANSGSDTGNVVEPDPIEALREFDQRGIAAAAHGIDDFAGARRDVRGIALCGPLQRRAAIGVR